MTIYIPFGRIRVLLGFCLQQATHPHLNEEMLTANLQLTKNWLKS